ncbi:MAG: hypothetical protein ACRBFS_27315 [Aureispira sp.]
MWLFSKSIDLLVLYLPVWLCWLVLCCLPNTFLQADIPLWAWVVFVLCIDVGHVWSTIFRTYLDKEEFQNHRTLLLAAPVACFLAVFGLVWYSEFGFWRVLAYLALFHFVKQQYGFLALYKAKAKDFGVSKFFADKWILYWITLYPVLYWHLAEGLVFNWFVVDDFVGLRAYLPGSSAFWINFFEVGDVLYGGILLAWLIEERWRATCWQWGKICWMLTTAFNWYGGIVYFNSDVVFTITNVVAHGVPYLALIVYYQYQKQQLQQAKAKPWWRLAVLIIPVVIVLGLVEEYFWDMWLYGERSEFFATFIPYPMALLESPWSKALAFALLALPQLTHYIIDGFIWKSNDKNPYVRQVFQPRQK